MKKVLILISSIILLSGCSNKNDTPEKQARAPRKGYSWTLQTGLGLKFFGQENKYTKFIFDKDLSTVSIEITTVNNNKNVFPVIRIFNIKDKNLNSIKKELKNTNPGLYKNKYDNIDFCEFKEIETTKPGVKRFVLYPAGIAEQEFGQIKNKEVIPATCNGFGIGNSGMRYFEIQKSNPQKLLFIEIGQEQPLFDENSITVTD